MPKAIFVKPVCWNDNGYRGPCGYGAASGFVAENGYGHEEWNGAPQRVWNGWQVFHTETGPRLAPYGATGDLALLMISMNSDKQYMVGIACGVRENTEEEMAEIANDLELYELWRDLWEVPSVRTRFDNKSALKKHWRKAHTWLRWRCRPELFHWFHEPVEIDLTWFERTKRLPKMHGGYMAVRPQHALAALDDQLPPEHPIRDWFTSGKFDDAALGPAMRATAAVPQPQLRNRFGSQAGNVAAEHAYVRYLQQREILVDPRHRRLEESFARYLHGIGITDIIQNQRYVDLRFRDPERGSILVEIKPVDGPLARYAIRTAMGQLLDYRFRETGNEKLLIVLEGRPGDDLDIRCASANGFGIAWLTAPDEFEIHWP